MIFRFNGYTEVAIDPDPREFVGMNVPAVTRELERLLDEVAPHVDVPFSDIVNAADAIVTEAAGLSAS